MMREHAPDSPFGCGATWGVSIGRPDTYLHVCNLPEHHDAPCRCKCGLNGPSPPIQTPDNAWAAAAGSATPDEHGVQIVLVHGLDCEGCQRVNDELSDDELVLYLRRGTIQDFQAQAVDRFDELAAEVVRLRAAAGSTTPMEEDT